MANVAGYVGAALIVAVYGVAAVQVTLDEWRRDHPPGRHRRKSKKRWTQHPNG